MNSRTVTVNPLPPADVDRSSRELATKPTGYYSNSRDELISLVPDDAGRVLEVGCGEGRLGERLKQLRAPGSVEVVGIELNEAAAAVARRRLDKVLSEDIENLSLDYAGYFDCVICADVLEHLRDPWRTLAQLTRCLRPEGMVVSSIPNIQHWRVVLGLLRGRFDYVSDGVMDSTHLRFFTRKTVMELFASAGLTIQSIRAHVPTPRGRGLNTCTGGLLEGFLTFQYHVTAKRSSM